MEEEGYREGSPGENGAPEYGFLIVGEAGVGLLFEVEGFAKMVGEVGGGSSGMFRAEEDGEPAAALVCGHVGLCPEIPVFVSPFLHVGAVVDMDVGVEAIGPAFGCVVDFVFVAVGAGVGGVSVCFPVWEGEVGNCV